jgi:hypothetical protein
MTESVNWPMACYKIDLNCVALVTPCCCTTSVAATDNPGRQSPDCSFHDSDSETVVDDLFSVADV